MAASSSCPRPDTGKSSSESKIIQTLRKENAALLQELTEIRMLHEQLLREGSSENFSQRRVNILKSQVFQLERQVALLSHTASNYAGFYTELFSMLEAIVNQLSSGHQASEEAVKTARQLQNRLSKLNRGYPDNAALPLLFTNGFAESAPRAEKAAELTGIPVTVLDVCLDKTHHINMKRVGQLETKLAHLFGELVKLQSSLQTSPMSPSSILLQPMREHCCDHVTSCCEVISDCCQDLLSLSLLAPTVPWQRKGPPLHPNINAAEIMKKMPAAVKAKKEVREAVERACNYFVYLNDMNKTKCDSLEAELLFHRSVYALQVSYVTSLIDAVRSGYKKFESSVQDLICEPLQSTLDGYQAWKSTPSDKLLWEFLQRVELHEEQLRCAIESFREHPQGTAALSGFGQNFLQDLAKHESRCARERSKAMETLEPVK